MPVYKDEKNSTWYAMVRYKDIAGVSKQKMKRGFASQKAAEDWAEEFKFQKDGDLSMPFSAFAEIYKTSLKNRLKLNMLITKENIIDKKIVPFFGNRPLNEIEVKDVFEWQNQMMEYRDEKGNRYSHTYIKTMHNQLSAIFNFAIRYYGLSTNPAAKAGNPGKEQTKEMLYWTKEEYLKFADVMMDYPIAYYAFEMLYWCGLRVGELLALTPNDFDFGTQTLKINKSYQRLKCEDVVTDPKTQQSIRDIKMPDFLCAEMQEYLSSIYDLTPNTRIFPFTKSYLHDKMEAGSKKAGVKRIRIHDLRHSHVSLLIELQFPVLAIAQRLGHKSIDITYRYAHLFPNKQTEMAEKLNLERME